MVLPIAAVIEGAVAFLFSLVPFFLIAGFTNGDWPGLHTVVLIPAFVFHTLFNLGLSLLVAQLVIPFRDIGNVVGHLSRIWMYMSPVIYPLDERLANAPQVLVTHPAATTPWPPSSASTAPPCSTGPPRPTTGGARRHGP